MRRKKPAPGVRTVTEKKAIDGALVVSRKSWSQEKVVEDLRGLSMQLGRTPTARDANACVSSAAITHFGSWNGAKRAAGLEACSRGPKRTNPFIIHLRAIAEGLRRLDEAIEEMTKLRKDRVLFSARFLSTDSTRYPSSLHNICRDLNWLKIRLGLLMIHLPELAKQEGFALGVKPPQANRHERKTA